MECAGLTALCIRSFSRLEIHCGARKAASSRRTPNRSAFLIPLLGNYNRLMERASTLGELMAGGYHPQSVKDEMRANLICKLKRREKLFPGIVGYDETVVPQLVNAILARHNLILLGLRGQAKSRIIRQLTNLLDEYIPIIAGSEINDDPFSPISAFGRQTIDLHQDSTPIAWVSRD